MTDEVNSLTQNDTRTDADSLKGLGSSLKPGKPLDEVFSKSSAERGLCSRCANYNWVYHLKRCAVIQTDRAFMFEDAFVNEYIDRYGSPDTRPPRNSYRDAYYLIKDAPYSGSYYMSDDKSETIISLGPCHSSDLSRHNCSVCNLILDSVHKVVLRYGSSLDLWLKNYSSGFAIQDTQMRFSVLPKEDSSFAHRYDPGILDICFQLPFDPNPPFYGYIVHYTMADFQVTEYFTRATIDPYQIDLSMVKNWLTYGTQAGKHMHVERTKFIGGFKVIDVHTNCVVVGPTDCTYMALSYVWGNISPFRVKSADFVVSKNGAGSLETIYAQLDIQKLPQTIRDAMFLVKSLGERYLWVDSLCITQDNESETKAMIRAMDDVYQAASLTIIAACGEDSEAGLPGLYPASRDLKLGIGSVEGIRLVATEERMNDVLAKSRWATRGWTYQEYHFSEKALIFVNQRVYFQQGTEAWGEVQPTRATGGMNRFLSALDTGLWHSYSQHVITYKQRDLTKPEDILNAFSAILQDLSSRYKTMFCWGLPTKHFELSLVWALCGNSVPARARRKCGNKFPSWSWAGWESLVYFPSGEIGVYKCRLTPAITWPWDSQYGLECKEDVFDSGILTIDVASTMLKPSKVRSEGNAKEEQDSPYFQLNNGLAWTSDVECILLATTIQPDWLTRPSRLRLHLAIQRGEDEIYYRVGHIALREESWEGVSYERKRIRLG
ncbi:hypothetical protein GLAREA_02195 [Glarea lozoyensis ATCC 20868]|uniref:Heterokaryon incompatibility domain-containing protein n=1 Tax=Glarea lozoyensis (strain ATCC 20868 / MF5171) TaxID=1116229 RepID=S3DIB5_GLAL2|nr:uncharacterized protein GLAREA_02195 [Glarea lozoyensis ATCC 20868]EPE26283.1 hypothetical protein GLAREA_02195 [Glarea lozoyensis ATCC 20868]